MLPANYPALVLFDNFQQYTTELFTILDNNDTNFVLIPAYCTDHLQLHDISVNKAGKEFL